MARHHVHVWAGAGWLLVILRVLDGWDATFRAVVLIITLFGGTALVSVLVARGALEAGLPIGAVLTGLVGLLFASAVRKAPRQQPVI